MLWTVDCRKWTDESFSKLSNEEKRQFFEDVYVCEAEHLFVCLAAFRGMNRRDWIVQEEDWKGIADCSLPDVFHRTLTSGAFVKGFFEYYLKVHGISDLSDFICRSFVPQCQAGEQDVVLELVKVEQDIKQILEHVSIETAYSKETWKSLGWDHRLQFGQYKRLVRSVVHDNCGAIINWQAISEGKYVSDDIRHLRALMECIQLGKGYTKQVNLLKSDIKLVSKHVSFSTLVSEECYKYLGKRYRMLYADNERELVEYVRIVVTVVKESFISADIEKLRAPKKSCFSQYVETRQEIVTLRRMFGYHFNRYQRYMDPTEENAKLECQQRNSIAIFFGICEKISVESVSPACKQLLLTVINDLKKLRLIDENQQDEVYCRQFAKVIENASAKYFFTCNKNLRKVQNFIKLAVD